MNRAQMAAGALALLVLLVAAAPADAALRFGSRSCPGNFQCARLTVPLDRSGVVPGTVRLSIERRRPDSGSSEGAVFALAGGPGQGASSVTEGFNRDLFGNIGRRDMIVVDQRGTGFSGALACLDLERPGPEPIDVRTAACARELGPRRAFYTTDDTVQDLEAVRAELGIEKITLFGVSYGTKVALAYAERFPEHVERLVLDSVVEAPGQNPFDLDSFAAMPRVLEEICRGECPFTRSLAADVEALVDRMAVAPLRGPLIDRRGRRRTRTVTPRDLFGLIRAGDLLADVRADVPGAVRAALDGDPAPLVRLAHGGEDAALDEPPPRPGEIEDGARTLSFTLQAATLCEEAPLPWARDASPADRERQAREQALALPDSAFEPFDRGTALAEDSNSLLLQCRRWPTAPARSLPVKPLPDVPVLIVGGREDTRTPLEVGARVAKRFPRAQLFEVPKTGHSALGTARCAETVVKRFFADRPLGTPCRNAVRGTGIRPVPPGRPASPTPQSTLAAVLLTLDDLERATEFGQFAGGGLRAGRFTSSGGRVTLHGYSFVPGVTVSGRLMVDLLRPMGRIKIGGSAAARGTLTLTRRGVLSGRLGGTRVSARRR